MALERSPTRAAPRAAGRAGALVALLALAGLFASACGGASPAASTSTSTTTSTSTSTSTTTTTLPRTTRVDGTGGTAYGAVERVPVVPVPDHATAAPVVPTGSPAAKAEIELAFHQVGSGPPLVLIMGQRGSMSWWDPNFIDALSQHYQVTFFDLPGVGYSQPDPAAHSVEALSDLTAGLIDALGLVDPVVLGWGLGGAMALALAERHPGLASRLVLVDTSPGGPGAAAPSGSVVRSMAAPGLTLVQLSHLFFPAAAGAARVNWLASIGQYPPDDVTAGAIATEAAWQQRFAADSKVASLLGTVTVPVLVIDSTADVVVPPANAALLEAGLAHVRQVVLPAAGYAGIFQDETRVVGAIETFTG